MNEPKMIGDHINEMLKRAAINPDDEPLNQYARKVRKFLGVKQTIVARMLDITADDLSAFERIGKNLTKVQRDNLKALFGLVKKTNSTPSNPSPSDALLKKCTTCNVEKPTDEFYIIQRAEGGDPYLFAACKECTKARTKINRKKRQQGEKHLSSCLTPTQTTQQRKSAP